MEQPTTYRCDRITRPVMLRLAACILFIFLVWVPVGAMAVSVPEPAAGSSWFVDMNRFAKSAHAGFTCESCHGTMVEHGRKHPDFRNPESLKKSAARTYDYSRCAKCHRLSYERYQSGGHAKVLAAQLERPESEKGVPMGKMAPTCGNCHVSHYDRSGLSRLKTGEQMTATCGKCHPEHTASYLTNIHGKMGVHLKNPDSAFCTDCHGAHKVSSLTNIKEALTASRRCHPKADTQFADFVIHDSMENPAPADSDKSESVLWISRIRKAALAVVALSLVFFFGHSFLWLLREFHEKLRKH